MRSWLVVSAVLFGGVAAATSAAAQSMPWDGYVSVGGGNAWYADRFGNYSNWLAQGRGTAEFKLSGNWGAQFDTVGTYQSLGEDIPALNFTSIDLAAHAFYRQAGQWLFGPIFQYRLATRSNANSSGSYPQYFAGAEAQGYIGMFSLYGQLAYQSTDNVNAPRSGWIGRVRARYFFTRDWFVEGNYQHSVLTGQQAYLASTEDIFGLATEYHLPTTPFGVFAQYSYSNMQFGSSSGNYQVSRALLGLKWNFGGHSLWDRETAGASLDPFQPPYQPALPPG